MKQKFKILNALEEDALYIASFCKKNKITIVSFISNVIRILKSNQNIFLDESKMPLTTIEQLSEKLSEDFRKKLVKENNRILGFYINTDKIVKSMYRDTTFYFEPNEKEKKFKHPFWHEYEFQGKVIREVFKRKYGITTDEDLMAIIKETLGDISVTDYMISLNRTRSKTLTTIRQ